MCKAPRQQNKELQLTKKEQNFILVKIKYISS